MHASTNKLRNMIMKMDMFEVSLISFINIEHILHMFHVFNIYLDCGSLSLIEA